VRARSRTVLIATPCAMFLVFFVATHAFAQGSGGRLYVGALYDPVFHVTDETSCAGVQHCCGSTDFAFQPGLGFDFARWPNITIRTQLDFRRVFFESNSRSETRLGVGVMIPIRVD
jgi:hypothetical protein